MKDSPQFYKFDTKASYGSRSIKIEATTSYNSFEHLSDSSSLVSNNNFKVYSGTQWNDLIEFSDSFHFAISDKLKNLLIENKLSGWGSFPITIKNSPTQYYCFYPTVIVGTILNLEAINNFDTDIYEFDLSTWNQTDFFTNEGTLNMICTEKVKLLFKKHKITNSCFDKYN